MIGFDRPLRPRWIYESLLLAQPGQSLSDLNKPFEGIAAELTGKEGKRKVRTVLFRCFIRDENNRVRVREELVLKELSLEHGSEFMKPVYLFYLIGRTPVLMKISGNLFRLYDFGSEINVAFLKKKMADTLGERDVTVRAVSSFIKTLGYFGVNEEAGGKIILKNKLPVNEEQMRVIIQLYAGEIIRAPQVSFQQFSSSLFNYFTLPDLRDLARKYNSQYWDHQHRVKEDYLVVF